MSVPFNVLVVDDETIQRETLALILSERSYQVHSAQDVAEACELLKAQVFDVILTDFRLGSEGSGLDVARAAQAFNPEAAVFIITAYADVQSVIEALHLGVVDYLTKPIAIESLLHKIALVQERRELQQQLKSLRQALNKTHPVNRLLGDSLLMQQVRDVISQVASARGSVLITGDTGTGKEVAARQIHMLSPRADQPFIAINCGAIPESLLESELFGYKKGAFTGAVSNKEGLFAVANGGTLFLDEIGDMPKSLQVKLLRALQERLVTPLGSTQSVPIDVRLIAATHRDLSDAIQKGEFRQDLFYRINVVEIRMPALRERVDDIPLLVRHCVAKYGPDLLKPTAELTTQALHALMHYGWPGNVRELENVIERALILSKQADVIALSDLPVTIQNTINARDISDDSMGDHKTLDQAVDQFMKQFIEQTLQACQGDKKESSKRLGLSLSSLYRKIEELGIQSK